MLLIPGIVSSFKTSEPPVSGYSLWLDGNDASVFSYSSGTVVSEWRDKSANAYHFANATVAQQPSRSVTQNGKDGVRFNSGDWIYNSSYNWSNSPFTAFIVMKYDTSNNNYAGIFGSDDNNGLALAVTITTDNFAIFKINSAPYDYNLAPTGSNADVAVWKSAGMSSGSVSVDFYKNGTAASSTKSFTGGSPGPIAVLGASGLNAPNDPVPNNTDVFEVVFYPSQLSDTDRNSVEAYLKTKWGTP